MTFLMTFFLFTTLGLILMKLGRFLLSEYGQTDGHTEGRTDRHNFGILIWKHVGTQIFLTQSSKLRVTC